MDRPLRSPTGDPKRHGSTPAQPNGALWGTQIALDRPLSSQMEAHGGQHHPGSTPSQANGALRVTQIALDGPLQNGALRGIQSPLDQPLRSQIRDFCVGVGRLGRRLRKHPG